MILGEDRLLPAIYSQCKSDQKLTMKLRTLSRQPGWQLLISVVPKVLIPATSNSCGDRFQGKNEITLVPRDLESALNLTQVLSARSALANPLVHRHKQLPVQPEFELRSFIQLQIAIAEHARS